MTPVVRAASKRHSDAGSLAEELPYWAWIDERTLLTRRGELVTLAELQPFGIAGVAPADLDHVLAAWMRLLGQLEEDVRFSLIVTRRPVRADAIAELGHERLPDEIFRSRAGELVRRNGELRFHAAWTLNPRLSEAPKKGNPLISWTKKLRSNGEAQRVYLRDSLARGAEQLQRIADAGRALVSDVCPSRVLEEAEATGVLGDLINRPGTVAPSHQGGALHWAWGLSELEAHRKHLTLDGEPLMLYSLVEPPPEATANILWDLLRFRAVWTWVWEWRGLSMDKARGRIRNAQKHFFSGRYSMIAHAQGKEGTDAALLDSAAAAESEALGDALVELQSEGIPWGELSASLSVHAPTLRELEELDSSVVRIFAGRDIKILQGRLRAVERLVRAAAGAGRRPAATQDAGIGRNGALLRLDLLTRSRQAEVEAPERALAGDARNPLLDAVRLRPVQRRRRGTFAGAGSDRRRQELPAQLPADPCAALQAESGGARPGRLVPPRHRDAGRRLSTPGRRRRRIVACGRSACRRTSGRSRS